MGNSKDNLYLIVIFTIIFLVVIVLILWVHNSTDSFIKQIKTTPEEKNSSHLCTVEEKKAEICTMEYAPVCANDNKTYSTGCVACSSGVDNWILGECIVVNKTTG